VALTRARDFLYVLWPMRYYHKRSRVTDRHSYAQLSRFFTPDVLATMDTEEQRSREVFYEADEQTRHLDLRARLTERWE
jgi:hypothetical protein